MVYHMSENSEQIELEEAVEQFFDTHFDGVNAENHAFILELFEYVANYYLFDNDNGLKQTDKNL